MKKLITNSFIFLSLFLTSYSALAFSCDRDDPTLVKMSEILAKKDLRDMITKKMSNLGIEILEDSIEYQVKILGNKYYKYSITASFFSALGSNITLENPWNSNKAFNMEVIVDEVWEYNNEGIPISKKCIVKNDHSYGSYRDYRFRNMTQAQAIFSLHHSHTKTE
jgi:hypothetical protein